MTMDTSYDLRLVTVGYKMPRCAIVLSFCSLNVHHIQDPLSNEARLLHLQVQNIMGSIFVPIASLPTESSSDAYPGSTPRLRRRSPSRKRGLRLHIRQRSVLVQDINEQM